MNTFNISRLKLVLLIFLLSCSLLPMIRNNNMNETLIIISNGIAMCENRWYAPSKEAALNLMSESVDTPQNIAIAIGCNEEITVLMPKTRVGSGSKTIKEAEKRAGLLIRCSESQRLVEMLEAIPGVIRQAKLKPSANVVVVISTEWSYYSDSGTDNPLTKTLAGLSEHIKTLRVIHLMKNENDRTDEFDGLVNQIRHQGGGVHPVSFNQIQESPVLRIQRSLSNLLIATNSEE
jgi:hypothetical protein